MSAVITLCSGLLAQLARAPRLHRGGREFEPLTTHQASLWCQLTFMGISSFACPSDLSRVDQG